MKKYFEGTLEEHNGEQEYSYSYLIEAEDFDEAEMKFKELCLEWYGEGEETEEGVYEFGFSAPMVINKGVRKIDKDEFIRNLVERYSIS